MQLEWNGMERMFLELEAGSRADKGRDRRSYFHIHIRFHYSFHVTFPSKFRSTTRGRPGLIPFIRWWPFFLTQVSVQCLLRCSIATPALPRT